MSDEQSDENITVKTEPSSGDEDTDSSEKFIPPLAIKKELPSRLPSFRPPRDLLLAGPSTSNAIPALKDFLNASKSTKKKYTPNVNVLRKKETNNLQSDEPAETEAQGTQTDQNQQKPSKSPVANKKRNSNFIQTKGVFSEGLAPGNVKASHSSYFEKSYNESSVLEKPKLVLNQKINKSDEDAKLLSIMKDDFIDDPNNMPDLNFLPSSLPTVYNAKNKYFNPNDIETTFQNLQVKMEKAGFNQNDDAKDQQSELLSVFKENARPKLLLFEFPKILKALDEIEDKKQFKAQSASETENKTKFSNLTSAGEGHWGTLRIHESGNAYFVVGSTVIPISISRHITRQDVISTNIDRSRCRGEIINLGTVDASFTCSTNFDDVH